MGDKTCVLAVVARVTGVACVACLALMGLTGCSSGGSDGAGGDDPLLLPGGEAAGTFASDTPAGSSGDDGATAAGDDPAGAGDDGAAQGDGPATPATPAGDGGDTGDGTDITQVPTGRVSLRGMCDIDSGFPGDETCLGVPDPSEGFQIHVGPNDYGDPAEINMFVMNPDDESSECFMDKLPNTEDIHFLQWELSGRPGTHHIINTLLSSDLPRGFGACSSFVGAERIPGASRPHMPLAAVAPENEGLGIPLAGNRQGQFDMHYFNFTQEPILREFWMNIYYVDESEVTERPKPIMGLGGTGWNFSPIQPGTMKVFQYECAIPSDGRIISMLGHTHAHGDRFTAHLRRAGGERVKIFEAFDYLEPQIYNFNSIETNPEFSPGNPGAWSGMLQVSTGDVLEWECEVNNDSESALRYVNEVETGEMCNIWGTTVGPDINCVL